MSTDYKGIDYGRGTTNINHKTGIRYGVISIHDVLQSWADSSEPFYIYSCPYCGNELKKGINAKRCPSCYKAINPDIDFDFIEPISFYYKDDGYEAEQQADDTDIFICKSPYFTYAQFCSPCAPGACHLANPLDEPYFDNKCYCFGHDWFENGKAPYPVFNVKTGEKISPK